MVTGKRVKKRRRILYIVGTLGLGGIERMTTDLSLALQRSEEWEAAICCLIEKTGPFVESLESQGVQIVTCGLTKKNLITFPFRFAHLLRRLQPDILHSHISSSMPWQVLGARLAGIKKIIFTQHSEYDNWNASFFARTRIWAYYAISSPFIYRYTAVSRAVQNHLAKMVSRPLRDFEVIYNPVDMNRFQINSVLRQSVRRTLGVEKDMFLVGNVARLAQPKAHLQMLEAARQVIQKDSSVRFVFIGDGPLRPTIDAKIKEMELGNHVFLIGQRTDVNDLYPALDMFILPSVREGFPLAVIEAMANGLPIIASDLGGIAEALGDQAGIRIPPGDSDSLARAIINLRKNPHLASELGKLAYARAIESFSLPIIVESYLRIYKSALANHHL
jgi:glycosyltransferase involved in cell wall biosynthesis